MILTAALFLGPLALIVTAIWLYCAGYGFWGKLNWKVEHYCGVPSAYDGRAYRAAAGTTWKCYHCKAVWELEVTGRTRGWISPEKRIERMERELGVDG